jgi:hypothetical protein
MRKGLLAVALSAGMLGGLPASASAGTLDQQQAITGPGGFLIYSGESTAQTFTAGITGGLDRADLYLFAFGTPSPDLIIEIRDASSSGPGSQILAGRSLPPSAVPMSGGYVHVGFDSPASVIAGHQYAIVAYTSAPSGSDYGWGAGAGDPYPRGGPFTVGATPPSGSWTSASASGDLAFATYVVPSASVPTGQRAAALKKCKQGARKKHWSRKRLAKCKRKARLLPV